MKNLPLFITSGLPFIALVQVVVGFGGESLLEIKRDHGNKAFHLPLVRKVAGKVERRGASAIGLGDVLDVFVSFNIV